MPDLLRFSTCLRGLPPPRGCIARIPFALMQQSRSASSLSQPKVSVLGLKRS
jgi:hypothetical protein